MVKTADEIRFNLTDGLLKAVHHGHYVSVKQLLRKAPAQFLARNGGNLLIHTLRIDNETTRDKIFRYFILKGANVRHVDKISGKDVLSWAAQLGRAEQVKTIIQQTATDIDILRKDRDLFTPLHHAVISGNIKVVQPIAEVCSRYKLNIDICDKHGLTPYIHARKLGYHDIAELLVHVGKASVFMSDGQSFKNADEWAVDGVRERLRKARIHMHKQKMSNKIGGQFVPALESKRIPTVVVTTSHKKSYVIDLSKSKNFLGHSLKEFDDKMALGLRPWEHAADAEAILNTSHGIASPSVTSLIAMNDATQKDHSDELDLPKLDIRTTSADEKTRPAPSQEFNYLMYILSLQSTDTYRQPAKIPETEASTVTSPDMEDRDNISSLAILIGKEGKSGRSSAKKSSSRASKAGRASSMLSSRKHESLTQSKKKGKKNKAKILPPIEIT